MTTKIVWRLKERPTPSEIIELKKAGLLKEDEAREILFSSETEEDRDKKSLEGEIKFLRELVEKLSAGNATKIVEVIREVKTPYYVGTPWYPQYQVWCGTATTGTAGYSLNANTTGLMSGNAMNVANMTSGQNTMSGASNAAFSSIKTF